MSPSCDPGRQRKRNIFPPPGNNKRESLSLSLDFPSLFTVFRWTPTRSSKESPNMVRIHSTVEKQTKKNPRSYSRDYSNASLLQCVNVTRLSSKTIFRQAHKNACHLSIAQIWAYLPSGQLYSTKTYSYFQIRRIFQKRICRILRNFIMTIKS